MHEHEGVTKRNANSVVPTSLLDTETVKVGTKKGCEPEQRKYRVRSAHKMRGTYLHLILLFIRHHL